MHQIESLEYGLGRFSEGEGEPTQSTHTFFPNFSDFFWKIRNGTDSIKNQIYIYFKICFENDFIYILILNKKLRSQLMSQENTFRGFCPVCNFKYRL